MATLLNLVALVCYLILLHMSGDWSSWKAATCLPDKCFCEKPRDSLVRQPSNTISNIAFVIVGSIVLSVKFTVDPAQKSLVLFRNFTCVYGASSVILGFMSGFFHTSLTFVGQWCDVQGMYLVVCAIIALDLVRLKVIGTGGLTAVWFLLSLFTGVIQYADPTLRRYLFAFLVGTALVLDVYAQYKTKSSCKAVWMKAALISLGVSYFVWELDLRHIVCWPTSSFQLHAFWHAGTALTVACMYKYFYTGRSNLCGAERVQYAVN